VKYPHRTKHALQPKYKFLNNGYWIIPAKPIQSLKNVNSKKCRRSQIDYGSKGKNNLPFGSIASS
jgi:hypothetical protein